ncbi:MAG: twin transmembrane helix small protein [Alphaproteobacteria bacterium]|jgi:hypothetical protein|nr:twin transmembrane helix small protein [Alphaproteobacteria bacterium]|tara:strand:+ start:711 stop:911 length:201 start_codon:yes stop_codon:yes gene_type:complete
MSDILPVLLILALAATLVVLLVGVFSMAKSGDFNRRHGNRLMRARVAFQGAALLILVLAWFFAKGS